MVFQGENVESNSLVLNIQPDEGISLSFGAKAPGGHMQIRPVKWISGISRRLAAARAMLMRP